MLKRIRKALTTNQTMKIVSLVNKSKKLLTVLGVLGMLWGSGPMQYLNAMTNNDVPTVYNSEVRTDDLENEVVDVKDIQKTTDANFDIKNVGIETELTSFRNANSKTFYREDDTYETVIYEDVIHYLENDEWMQVNNSIIEVGDSFENLANKFKLKFPKKLEDNKKIKLSMQDYSISWSILNVNSSQIEYDNSEITPSNMKELPNITQSIVYPSVLPNVDVEYIITGSSIKENIILKEYIEDFSISFEYKLKNLSLEVDDFDNYVLLSNDGEEVFSLSDFFMFDSNEFSSYDINVTINESDEKTFVLELIPSDDWLQQANYPVIIDPTYNVIQSTTFMWDTTVRSNEMSSNFDLLTYMQFGSGLPGAEYESLFKFWMPEHIIPEFISSATLNLTRSSQSNGEQINIYRNTQNFYSDTVTWSTKPTHSSSTSDVFVTSGQTQYEIDITSMVKYWQTHENYGMTIASNEPHDAYNSVKTVNYATTSSKPVVEIIYVDANGIKDYWTYDTQPLGDSGTGLIAENTGVYTYVRNDISFSNEKTSLVMDMTFSHDYAGELTVYGHGWRSNYDVDWDLKVAGNIIVQFGDWREVSYDQESSCDTYVSASPNNYNCYLSEEGDGSVFVDYIHGNDEYLLTKDGQIFAFNSLKNLSRIIFGSGHELLIERGTDDRIEKVSDDYGNYIDYYYRSTGTLMYSYLYTYDDTTSSTYLLYRNYYAMQSDNTLNYVRVYNYYDTTSSSYTYHNRVTYDFDASYKLISFTNNLTNDKVTYTYTSGFYVEFGYIGKKIASYTLMNGTKNLGEISFTYNGSSTVKEDQYGNKTKMVFDAYGHTVNVQDHFGNAMFYEYQDNTSGSNENLSNKLISSTPIQTSQMSYIENETFESQVFVPINTSGGWYKNLGSPANGIMYYTTHNGEKVMAINRNDYYQSAFSIRQNIELDKGVYTLRGRIHNPGNPYYTSGAFITLSNVTEMSTIQNVYNSSDFIDVEITFTISADNTDIYVELYNLSQSTAYFDDVIIETDSVEKRVNYVNNPSFENQTNDWVTTNSTIQSVNDEFHGMNLGDSALSVTQSMNYQTVSQELDMTLSEGDGITFGGWIKGFFNSNDPDVEVVVEFTYEIYILDIFGSPIAIPVTETLNFNGYIEEWQYALETIYIKNSETGTYGDVEITIKYKGENELLFDGIQVYKEEIFTNVQFNEDGNVEKIFTSLSNSTDIVYSTTNHNQVDTIKTANETIDYGENYIYDSYNNLTQIVNENGTSTFTYDSINHEALVETRIQATSGKFYTNTVSYSNQYQYLDSKTNEYGDTLEYNYDSKNGLLENLELPNGDTLYYDYDNNGNLTSNYINSNLGKADYTYNSSLKLSTINVNGLLYTVNYNDLGQITSFEVEGIDLVTKDYVEKIHDGTTFYTSLIDNEVYANGNTFRFTYDEEDRISRIYYKNSAISNEELRYEYIYDSLGRLIILDDHKNNKTFYYSYNVEGQISRISDESNNFRLYFYDDIGRPNAYEYNIDGINRKIEYNYTEDDSTVDSVTYYINPATQIESEYYYSSSDLNRQYKNILRSGNLTSDIIYSKYFYYDDSDIDSTNGISQRVYKIVYLYENGMSGHSYQYEYEYNEIGNIVQETTIYSEWDNYDGFTETIRKVNYHYDSLNQLTREDLCNSACSVNPVGTSIVYIYNTNGNRTFRKVYNYASPTSSPTGTLIEEQRLYYINDWKDQLTSIKFYENGVYQYTETLSYDDVGNVILVDDSRSSYNDDNYTWEGRELISESGYCHTLNYEYDDNGYRTERSSGTCGSNFSYEYILEGDKVIVEYINDAGVNHTIYYTYGIDGQLISMNYDGTEYFYKRNLLDDIIGLYNISGTEVVFYEYDSFGNIIDMTESDLAHHNPYRYRGYRFDETTKLYYLNSRYYKPITGRFLNADGYMGTPGEVLSHNMYTYVKNNPVMYTDPSGYVGIFASIAIGIAVEVGLRAVAGPLNSIPFLIDIAAELLAMMIINVLDKLEPLYNINGKTIITIAATAIAGGLAIGVLTKSLGKFIKGPAKKAMGEVVDALDDKTDDIVKYTKKLDVNGPTSRSSHRRLANLDFADELQSNKTLRNQLVKDGLDPEAMLAHMNSGKSGLLNPKGFEWHHSLGSKEDLLLISNGNHRAIGTLHDALGRGGYYHNWR